MTGDRPEIERVLRFIAENLERPLSVAGLARRARLSEFHFQRVFHAAVGESVGRYLARQRLELAALRLCYEPDRSITDIALVSGYSSASNFSKAFATHFGCSPTQVRSPEIGAIKTIGKLTSCYGKNFRPADLYTLPPGLDPTLSAQRASAWEAKLRFEASEGTDFACLACPDGYELSAIEQTWSELIARCRQLGLTGEDVDAWGITHDSPHLTASEFRRYHACVPCPRGHALPAPLFRGQLHAGRYAVFDYAGPTQEVEGACREIYSCWFAHSSLAPADFAPVNHYVGDWPEHGQVRLELWFRVRPRD